MMFENSGGTTLTVIGNNLNSSASPYLRVILNTTTSGRLNKNITIINGVTNFLLAVVCRYSRPTCISKYRLFITKNIWQP